jgi:hypothetical protein
MNPKLINSLIVHAFVQLFLFWTAVVTPKHIALAFSEGERILRERGLREREQNDVEVTEVDGKRWKLMLVLFVLLVIGTVTTL